MHPAFINFGIQNTTIIFVFLAIDKMMLKKHTSGIAQWPKYLTIGNLSHKIQRS